MKNYILLSLVLVLATLWSCNKTLDFDDEGYANQLILNSIIWPDSCFSADIAKSTSILARPYGQNPNTTEGTLDLFENGSLLKHLISTNGHFRAADIKPKVGNTYRVVVSSNSQQLEAETTIPEKVEVISIDTTSEINNFGTKATNYKIKIKDPDGDDYYRIVVTNESLTQYIDSNDIKNNKYYLYKNQQWVDTKDPVFESVYNNLGDDVLGTGPENSYYIFPDDYFKDKEYSVQLVMYGYVGNSSGYGYGNSKSIYSRTVLHVQKLSKDLYTYMKYLKLYDNYHENPFAEPVPVYSNVKNGTGIFAGFNEDAKFTFEKINIPYSMDTIKIE